MSTDPISPQDTSSTVPSGADPAACVGFYGKLPARGDFVQRNLPRSFIDPWDNWLQEALAGSREQLGEQWLRSYLTSPVWRFALSGGLCGEQVVAGVLIPSVDRVGRYFPLAITALLPETVEPLMLHAAPPPLNETGSPEVAVAWRAKGPVPKVRSASGSKSSVA